jgi:hypothetical protein
MAEGNTLWTLDRCGNTLCSLRLIVYLGISDGFRGWNSLNILKGGFMNKIIGVTIVTKRI